MSPRRRTGRPVAFLEVIAGVARWLTAGGAAHCHSGRTAVPHTALWRLLPYWQRGSRGCKVDLADDRLSITAANVEDAHLCFVYDIASMRHIFLLFCNVYTPYKRIFSRTKGFIKPDVQLYS